VVLILLALAAAQVANVTCDNKTGQTLFDFSLTMANGSTSNLSVLNGNVVMLVNVASF